MEEKVKPPPLLEAATKVSSVVEILPLTDGRPLPEIALREQAVLDTSIASNETKVQEIPRVLLSDLASMEASLALENILQPVVNKRTNPRPKQLAGTTIYSSEVKSSPPADVSISMVETFVHEPAQGNISKGQQETEEALAIGSELDTDAPGPAISLEVPEDLSTMAELTRGAKLEEWETVLYREPTEIV